MKKILFSVVRNEAPFLLEWIAYNIQLGFDTIVIYSNNCDDGTHELLDELARHGVLQHFRHDPGEIGPQPHAVTLFMNSGILSTGDHVMFLDADEFLNIKIGTRMLDDLVDYIGDYQGIFISWRRFGDSGNTRFTGRFISSDYTGCSEIGNGASETVKTFVKMRKSIKRIGIHKPQFDESDVLESEPFLTGNGMPIDIKKSTRHERQRFNSSPNIAANEVSYSIAQINHYQYRSAAAYDMKNERGVGGNSSDDVKYVQKNADKFNDNRAHDDTILFYEKRTSKVIKQLMLLGNIRTQQKENMASFRKSEDKYLQTDFYNLYNAQSSKSSTMNNSKRTSYLPAKTEQLIVHIGQMKTGSTTLQSHLYNNRKILEDSSIYYPEGLQTKNAHHELATLAFGKPLQLFSVQQQKNHKKTKCHATDLIANIRKKLSLRDFETMLLSSEFFANYASEDGILALNDLAKSFSNNTIYVAYVRSPIGGLISRLQQSLYPATLMRPARWQLQTQQMLYFKRAFGEQFVLRKFDRNRLHKNDIAEDFFHQFLPNISCPPKLKNQKDFNKSLSPEAMYIIQRVKFVLKPDGSPVQNLQTQQLIQFLKQADLVVDGYTSPKPKPELIIPIMRLQTDALRLRKEFGIEFDDVDYDEIGKETDIDLEKLRIVENICDVNFERVNEMIHLLVSSEHTDPELISLLNKIAVSG